MNNSTPSQNIKTRIAELEAESSRLENEMKDRLDHLYEGIKPANALKAAFKQVTSTPGMGTDFLNVAVNLVSGYLGTRFLWGAKNGVLKRVAGAALQMGAGNSIVKNAGVWKRFASNLFKKDKQERPETIPFEPVADKHEQAYR